MKVVILAGGMGTRLREETEFRPKPMVEVGGRPILWHIMKTYARYGHKDFVIALGYKGEQIKRYFLDYQAMSNDFTVSLGEHPSIRYHNSHGEADFTVTCVDTGLTTNTGGRVARLAPYLGGETFMVTYGDGVGDVDLDALLACHRAHGRLATVTAVVPPSRFGNLDIGDDGAVTRFLEKPPEDGWVSAGFFVFEPGVLDFLDSDCVLEREPLQRLAEQGQLAAYPHRGFWHPMDTYRDMQLLNDLWDSGRPPWRVWTD